MARDVLITCQHCHDRRASGAWRVDAKIKLLCAECGMSTIPQKWDFFRQRFPTVKLIKSFTTDFVPVAPSAPKIPLIVPVLIQRSRHDGDKPLRVQFVTDPDYDPNPDWLR